MIISICYQMQKNYEAADSHLKERILLMKTFGKEFEAEFECEFVQSNADIDNFNWYCICSCSLLIC